MQILTIPCWSGILPLMNQAKKNKKIQKHCLKKVLSNYDSHYDIQLRESGKVRTEINWFILQLKFFKTVSNLNPNYIRDIFTLKLDAKVRPNDILVKHHNAITYCVKNLKTLGPETWNQLSGNIQSETPYTNFKEYIENWLGPRCRCNICINIWGYISYKLEQMSLKYLLTTALRTAIYFDYFYGRLGRIWSVLYYNYDFLVL